MAFNESAPWKRELHLCSEILRRSQERSYTYSDEDLELSQWDFWGPQTEDIFQIEKAILLGCIAVRRLSEMPFKVSSDLFRGVEYEVVHFPLKPRKGAPDHWGALVPFEFYDLSSPLKKKINPRVMCNYFLHSHVQAAYWQPVGMSVAESLIIQEDDPRLGGASMISGVMVTTDHKNESLVLIKLSQLADCFERVSEDDVSSIRCSRDRDGKLRVDFAGSVN